MIKTNKRLYVRQGEVRAAVVRREDKTHLWRATDTEDGWAATGDSPEEACDILGRVGTS